MNNLHPAVPPPLNEPIKSFRPGSPERASLKETLEHMRSTEIEVPAFIGGEEVRTGRTTDLVIPHEHTHKLGTLHLCGEAEVKRAINASLEARRDWARMHWTDRAAIFLKAAELLAGPWRDKLNASTMLGQSKNVFQAEIDAACELIDFFRFNVHFMKQIYEDQPLSPPGVWNQVQYRGLEGFVFAVTPFNFTSIQANLAAAPALMGNTVIWKPSTTAAYSAYYIYRLLEAAGLPPGVINILPGDGADVGDPVMRSEHLAGLHFTGSTPTFQHLWRTIGENIGRYRTYPRIVGETGGKDFILAHASAEPVEVATAIVRGSFEYQGQKCSAASRVYVPKSLWPQIRESMLEQLSEIKMGPPEDFSNFVNAVIDQRSFDKITGYIKTAKSDGVNVIAGGEFSDAEGFYVKPTVLEVGDPTYTTMCEEIFGPVVSLYVYDEARYQETLKVVNETSPYALTGAIFARDRRAVVEATNALEDAAGNFYINDKPTGAVVGQQPFGGARASGTNDKAGSYLNLTRWVSPRSIKETFVPAKHYGYPFLEED
jgi:1-pyrroline-5-carboxylate dehydrogenase